MVDAQNDGGFRAINAGNYLSMAGSSDTPGTPDVRETSSASVTDPSPAMGFSAQPASQATTTEQPSRSHPTLPTAMTLTSSAPSAQDNGSAAQLPTYGTRSRNRPGKPRINYAEDADVDFEYSVPAINTAVERHTSSSERTSRSPLTGDSRQSPTVSNTKNSVAGMLKGAQKVFPQLSKEPPIPGTSTFSANPNGHTPPTAPKKRKNAANHGTNTGQTTGVASAPLSARRVPLTQSHSGARETNMLTFEKSKAILKNGKLVADDGTIVAVNGE
ncbi:putative PHD type zinc finger protein with BAH domain-containing protein [Coniosporium apollinis]|uniref:PHD type zinc finger protein with BAH domain-containing protein n=1 Tax=Coniosporium apollinis TaxID=61459 RepID=A0ABQ9P3C8_9PEZI|nr:putative PHD type zinc finger protein with BAH domain-containing protein [Coniosporium apollinis]